MLRRSTLLLVLLLALAGCGSNAPAAPASRSNSVVQADTRPTRQLPTPRSRHAPSPVQAEESEQLYATNVAVSTPQPAPTRASSKAAINETSMPVALGEVINGGRIRNAPVVDGYSAIGLVEVGDKVMFLEQRQDWYKVRVMSSDIKSVREGTIGWINASLLSEPSAPVEISTDPLPTARPEPTSKPGATAQPARPSSPPASAPNNGRRTGAVCNDGTYSSATGRGACSHHGGVKYWLYGP